MSGCHYRRLQADGDYQLFDSTDLTRSNWSPEIQHGSPPLVEGTAGPLPPWFEGIGGYFDSVHWRAQRDDSGGAVVGWLSPLVHLVDTEDTTPLQKLAMVVDSANGVGMVLDSAEFLFMNTDTVLHLHRLPAGRDFGLRSRASIGPDGIGVTTAELFDRNGFIGTSAQTLLVQRR